MKQGLLQEEPLEQAMGRQAGGAEEAVVQSSKFDLSRHLWDLWQDHRVEAVLLSATTEEDLHSRIAFCIDFFREQLFWEWWAHQNQCSRPRDSYPKDPSVFMMRIIGFAEQLALSYIEEPDVTDASLGEIVNSYPWTATYPVHKFCNRALFDRLTAHSD